MTNTDTLSALSLSKLQAWAVQNRDLAMMVCKYKAFAELQRERVNAYVAPIFARYGFKDEDGNPIASADKLYHCEDDAACAAFYAECSAAHVANGWKGDPECCPALVAEDALMRAEHALLCSLGRLVGLDGSDFSRSLELRAKALEIALGACLAAK